MAAEGRVLAIAVASGRVGHVFLIDRDLVALGMSRKASTSPEEAAAHTAKLIETLRPGIVVTERVLTSSKKGPKAREVILAITAVSEVADVTDIAVARGRGYENRFDEAKDLTTRYPASAAYLPKVRKPWEAEPKTLIYFEALALLEIALGRKRL